MLISGLALACSALLLFLAVVATRASGRVDNPSVLLAGTWAAVLLVYALAGDFFYDVDVATLAAFASAPFAFYLGDALAGAATRDLRPMTVRVGERSVAATILWAALLLVLLPAYYGAMAGEADLDTEVNLIAAIRIATLDQEGEARGFSVLRNLQPFSYVLALFAIVTLGGGNWPKKLLAGGCFLLALAYGLLTGSKGIVPSLAISLCITLIFLNQGRIRATGVIPIAATAFLAVVALLRYVNLAFETEVDELEAWGTALRTVAGYAAAPVVALDTYMRDPGLIDLAGQSLSRPFIYVANAIAAQLGVAPPFEELPSLHLAYVPVGPTVGSDVFNTYSYLGSYVHSFSTFGLLAPCALIGFALGWLHRRAKAGNLGAMLVYVYLAKALLLSFNGENIILDVANVFKFYVAAVIIYRLTRWLLQRLGEYLRATNTEGKRLGPWKR